MGTRAMSRRTALEAGVCALAAIPAIAGANTEEGLSPKNEQSIRNYYAAWEIKDWHPLDILLADNFTFTSANNDDHIGKSTFKARCWESQIDFIERFELQRVIGNGDDAFVMCVCRTKKVRRSATWSISALAIARWRPSSAISVRRPAFHQQ
jgi:SnoaL-like domain